MPRKLLYVTSLFYLISLANDCWASNFYVGLGGGPETADFSQDAHIEQPRAFNVINKERKAGRGWFGSFFGGYAWNRDQFFLAGEANINISSVDTNNSNKEYIHQKFSSTKFSIHSSVGLSVLPGYLLNDMTLFYGRLGVARGHFESDTTDISLFERSQHLEGFRWGFGMKQTLTSQLAVILEYSQINYESLSGYTFDSLSSTSKFTQITPTTSQAEIGMIYNFS